MRLNLVLSRKIREYCVFWLFFKIDLRLAISFKRSRRELSVGMAEHSFVSKNKKVLCILFIFQGKPTLSHIIQKTSARAFQ